MKRRKSYNISKKIKSKKAAPYLLLLFVVSLSIAYSAFGTELNIGKFISDIRLEKDIRITGVNATSNVCEYTSDADGNEMVTCGTEKFYVLEKSQTEVKVFAANNITLSTTNPIQSSDLNPTYFSSSSYWWDSENSTYTEEFAQQTGSANYIYVYDSRSNIYQYVEAYRETLEAMGVHVKDARMINYDESYALGIRGDANTNLPSWLTAAPFWFGFALNGNLVFLNYDGGSYTTSSPAGDTRFGIRPVVVISTYCIAENSSAGSSIYTDYNISSISTGIKLPYEDSSVTYNVEITNIEATEMGILEITGLPDNLEYELGNYRLQEKICDDSKKCNLGITKEIQVTIKYKSGHYDSQNTSFNLNLNFNFQPFYNVKYTNMISDLVYNVGDVITYGTESFYVMEDMGDTVKLLSGSNITLSTIDPKQSSDLNPTYFASPAYWWDTQNETFTEEFLAQGIANAYVYNSKSNIFQYVEAYRNVLEKLGLNVLEARLMNFAETRVFGCVGGSCANAPSWIWATSYWTGAAQKGNVLYIGNTGGHYSSGPGGGSSLGVRPVIVIEKKLELPYDVIANSTFNISFGQNAPDNVIVKMDGVKITNYTYENGVLSIPNVSGDVEIIKQALPDEYQGVEYIESHGEEYIDTMFIPNQDTRVIADYQYMNVNAAFLFGSRTGTLSNAYTANISGSNAVSSFGKSGNNSYATADEKRHVINKNKNLVYLDGNLVLTQTQSTFTAPGSLEIFATYNNGTKGYLPSAARIYSFKIYDNDILVRDFVPCYRKSDGEIGLFDTINNEFYTNLGTGSFEKGSDIN